MGICHSDDQLNPKQSTANDPTWKLMLASLLHWQFILRCPLMEHILMLTVLYSNGENKQAERLKVTTLTSACLLSAPF